VSVLSDKRKKTYKAGSVMYVYYHQLSHSFKHSKIKTVNDMKYTCVNMLECFHLS